MSTSGRGVVPGKPKELFLPLGLCGQIVVCSESHTCELRARRVPEGQGRKTVRLRGPPPDEPTNRRLIAVPRGRRGADVERT